MSIIEQMARAMIENIREQNIGYTVDVVHWDGTKSVPVPMQLMCDGVIDFKAVAEAAFDIFTARPSDAVTEAGVKVIYKVQAFPNHGESLTASLEVFHDMIQAMKEGK